MFKCPNIQNIRSSRFSVFERSRFGHSNIGNSNLLRISNFEFRHSRRRRGTAEIELLLVIPILLTLLFITRGLLYLGEARLQNVWDAQQKAYSDAIHNTPPRHTNGPPHLQPIDGFTHVRPGLPNRLSQHESSVTVTYAPNIPLRPVTLTDTAAFPAPAWSYSAFPVHNAGGSFNDTATTRDWYADYAGEVRDPLENPLGLSPSNPP